MLCEFGDQYSCMGFGRWGEWEWWSCYI